MKRVTVSVVEVQKGLQYRGRVEFNRVYFKYELILGTHLNEFHEEKDPSDEMKRKFHHRNLFQFSLTNKDGEIEIKDRLFGFLVAIIAPAVVDYYYSPEIKKLKENLIKQLRGKVNKSQIKNRYTYSIAIDKIPPILFAV